ncbi:MAG: LytTR family DNA-binding domain-containing protein [bacterium]
MTIRCMIVDDEPLGRERIAALLRTLPDAELVGMCANGADAIESIGEVTPDLLFLDVQMPEVDGFGVLSAIARTTMPEVIFVTAHDRYALKAFEVHAQDYLLKPFDPDRLFDAYHRAAERVRLRRMGASSTQLLALIDEMERVRAHRTRVPIKVDGRVTFLPVDEIDWMESADNHVKIHANGATHLVRRTLQNMQASLSPTDFVRVHRSSIVNVKRIKEIQPWFNGDYVVLLRDGTRVQTSRGYRARLEALML